MKDIQRLFVQPSQLLRVVLKTVVLIGPLLAIHTTLYISSWRSSLSFPNVLCES